MKVLIFVLFSIYSTFSFAVELSCGSSQAIVVNAEKSDFPYFGLTISDSQFKKKYKFHASNDFFKIKCVSDIGGKLFFLIKNTCSGSSCMANFALIDSTNGRVLVHADKSRATIEDYNHPESWGNSKEIEKILKRKPNYFKCKAREITKREICLVSKVELG